MKVGGLDHPWLTVIGVVGDVHHAGLDAAPSMQMYVPHAQWPSPDSDMTFVIRTTGPPNGLALAARQAIHSVDSTQLVSRVMPLEEYVALSEHHADKVFPENSRHVGLAAGAFYRFAILDLITDRLY